MSVQVDILSLQPLDTLNMNLELSLTITLVWRDPRVNMESLNYDDNLNNILDSAQVNGLRISILYKVVTLCNLIISVK